MAQSVSIVPHNNFCAYVIVHVIRVQKSRCSEQDPSDRCLKVKSCLGEEKRLHLSPIRAMVAQTFG